jgi:death on curing protein
VSERQPTWLLLEVVLAIQDLLIAEHGGLPGLRDRGLLESAIEAPKQLHAHGTQDMHALAARYAVGISRNHPFVDGNKRAAFTCAAVFLARNGWRITATQVDVVETMVALADRRIDEPQLISWLRDHSAVARGKRGSSARSASTRSSKRGKKKRDPR